MRTLLLCLLAGVASASVPPGYVATIRWAPVTTYTDGKLITAHVYYKLYGSTGGTYGFIGYLFTNPAHYTVQRSECFELTAAVWNPTAQESRRSAPGCITVQ